jgi:hypothetical protein
MSAFNRKRLATAILLGVAWSAMFAAALDVMARI